GSLAAQPLRGQSPPAHGLQGRGLPEDREDLVVGQVVDRQQVGRSGGHRRASITSPSVVTTRSISACVTINGGTNRSLRSLVALMRMPRLRRSWTSSRACIVTSTPIITA